MRESALTSINDCDTEMMESLLPSCLGSKSSLTANERRKRGLKDGINMLSSDSEEEDNQSKTVNTVNGKGNNNSGSDSDEVEPEEYEVTNADGSKTKMILTASGPIPLDFSNTKIIQDGKVFNINDLSAFSAQGNNAGEQQTSSV